MEPLPKQPPAGKIRYKAICRDPKQNPFRTESVVVTQTVDVDADTSRIQVEAWAREAAVQKGIVFMRLEEVR